MINSNQKKTHSEEWAGIKKRILSTEDKLRVL